MIKIDFYSKISTILVVVMTILGMPKVVNAQNGKWTDATSTPLALPLNANGGRAFATSVSVVMFTRPFSRYVYYGTGQTSSLLDNTTTLLDDFWRYNDIQGYW